MERKEILTMANTEEINVEFLTGPLSTMLDPNSHQPQSKEGTIY